MGYTHAMEAIRKIKPESVSGLVKIVTVSHRGFAANDPNVHQGCSGCSYDIASARLFYLKDRVGSIVGITDDSGSIVETYEYSAFGIMTVKNANGVEISESNYGNSYTYTGRRFDAETGLYYYRNRMYSAELGRFMSEDPVGYRDGYNLYQYAHNNPLKYVDPLGTTALNNNSGSLYPGGANYPISSNNNNSSNTSVSISSTNGNAVGNNSFVQGIESWFSSVTNHLQEHGRVGWIASFGLERGVSATVDFGSARLADETGSHWTNSGHVREYYQGRTLASIDIPFIGGVSAENTTTDNGETWNYGDPQYNESAFIELLRGRPVTFNFSFGIGYVYENIIVIGGN